MSVSADAPKPAVAIATRVAQLRQALVESVTDDDVRAVTRKLIDVAKEGDLRAVRLLLHYALGKSGDTPHAAAPLPPQKEDRSAATAPAFDLNREPPLDGLTLSDLVTRQIQQERAAVTKRGKTEERKPVSAPVGRACAKTEAMCLVNLPGSNRP